MIKMKPSYLMGARSLAHSKRFDKEETLEKRFDKFAHLTY